MSYVVAGNQVVYPESYIDSPSRVRVLELATGAERLRFPVPDKSGIAALSAKAQVVVINSHQFREMSGYELRSASRLWAAEVRSGAAVSVGSTVVVSAWDLRSLFALEVTTGKERWRFEIPQRKDTSKLWVGFPYLTVVPGGAVVLVTTDGQILRVSIDTGRLEASGEGVVGSAFTITDDEVIYGGAWGLTAVNHRTMQRTEEIDWAEETLPLYGSTGVSTCGILVSQESLFWTTIHGAVMGIDRRATRGRRRTWVDQLPNAMFPLGRGPIAWGNCLYAAPGVELHEPTALYCYTSD